MRDEISPCGLVRIEWQLSTGLMSHEINSPRFIDARDGQPFLTLWDEQWDGSVHWESEGRFLLSLRNYGRPGNLEAEVDLPARIWRPIVPPGEPEPLEGIEQSIRKAFAETEKAMPPAVTLVPASSKQPGLWDIVGLVALIAMACGAWYLFR